MKPKLTKRPAALISLFFSVAFTHAQTTSAFDDYVLKKMKDNNIPGLCLSLVKNGKIAFTKGYGCADVDKNIPFTPNTIHSEIASISKTITGTAIMKLWEQGLFQLDDPVNNYLPFPVTNPFFPTIPITFRMLLNHTSSLLSNTAPSFPYYWVAPGTAQELGSFLHNLLVPGGVLYNASISYNNYAPGSQFNYSNIGYALLGYLVQRMSGVPFDVYCNQNIFQPLCMNQTSWFHSGVDTNIVSRPYNFVNGSENHFVAYNLYELADYPSRQIKTSVINLSRFMLMHINYGTLDGVRIIDSTTEVKMRSFQGMAPSFSNLSLYVNGQAIPNQMEMGLGLMHHILGGSYNKDFYGWAGGDLGITTNLWFSPSDRTGVIAFTNSSNKEDFLASALQLADIAFTLEKFVGDTILTTAISNLNCSYSSYSCQHNLDFWKNNSTQWALNSIPMKLGTKLYYSKNQLFDLMNKPDNDDASIVLAKALITAKFNVAQGSELSPVVQTINASMNLIGDHRLPYDNPVPFSSATGIQMLALAATLDSYNSGNLNTTSCSGALPTITSKNNPIETETSLPVTSLSAFPNPSSGNITISFSVPQNEKISVAIYDMQGHLVKTIVNGEKQKGNYNSVWNAADVNPGVYVIRLQSLEAVQTKKIVVVK